MHIEATSNPIVGPDDQGAFRRLGIRSHVRPFVLDSDVLHRDLLRSLKAGQRTTLVNAANSGMIRIFVADRQAEEMLRDLPSWATEEGVEPDALKAHFSSAYLPIFRVVPVPEGLLTPEEAQRVERLALKQASVNDIPSATLSLLLQAPLLSEDIDPLKAVYGERFDYERHRAWLETLQATGDMGLLAEMGTAGGMMMSAITSTAGTGIRHIRPRLPAGTEWLLLIVTGLLIAWCLQSSERRHRLGEFAAVALEIAGPPMETYQEAKDRYDSACPRQSSWAELGDELGRDALLARTCLWTLARTGDPVLSAKSLAACLPRLSIGQGEQRVREILEAFSCFEKPYHGRWQAGYSLGLEGSNPS